MEHILSTPLLRTIPAGHELAPGRAAQRLHVVVLQLDSLRCQPVQSRGFDLRAVVANIPETLIVHQDEDDVRLRAARLLEVVPSVAQLGVPVFPRQLNAPRLRDDEAEEQTHRDPQEEHVSAGLGAPGAVTVALRGRDRGAHVRGEQQHLGIGFASRSCPLLHAHGPLTACDTLKKKKKKSDVSVSPRGEHIHLHQLLFGLLQPTVHVRILHKDAPFVKRRAQRPDS